jgi:hypothetical protein
MSCGNGIRSRGRTELDFSCRKPFNDHHKTTAFGASPKIAGTGGGDLVLGMWCGTEQLKTKGQSGGTFAVGDEAEVANTHETFGEEMQHRASVRLSTSVNQDERQSCGRKNLVMTIKLLPSNKLLRRFDHLRNLPASQ